MIADALLALACSFLMFLTIWLVLPILVLAPLSIYFAFRFYKKTVARFRSSPVLARVAGLIPMAIVIAAIPAALSIFDGYRA